jgi:hypothetical protein
MFSVANRQAAGDTRLITSLSHIFSDPQLLWIYNVPDSLPNIGQNFLFGSCTFVRTYQHRDPLLRVQQWRLECWPKRY